MTADDILNIRKLEEFHQEFRIILPDSSVRFIEGHGKVIFSEDGVPERMVGMNRDITPRIQSVKELNQKNEELASLNEELLSQEQELQRFCGATDNAGNDAGNQQTFNFMTVFRASTVIHG